MQRSSQLPRPTAPAGPAISARALVARRAVLPLCACMVFAAMNLSGSLTERSPFLPPNFRPPEDRAQPAPPPAASQGPLSRRFEFRGVYELDGEYRFLITDKRTREGKWVALDDASAPFHVTSFDLAENAIVLNHENQTESIPLERLSGNPTPLPVSGAPPPATARPATAQATAAATTAASGEPPTRTRRPTVRRTGDTTASTAPAPPPPPQWLQERREQAARERAAMGPPSGPPPGGPPNIQIPPPPNFTPPPPPTNLPQVGPPGG